MTESNQKSDPAGQFTLDKAVKVVIDAAIESAVNAFLVLLMGNIALTVVGGLVHGFTPSLPPGVSFNQGTSTSATWNSWTSAFRQHEYLICFCVLFGTTACFRLLSSIGPANATKSATRLQKIGQRLSSHWFGLIVGNAFGAMIATFVVGWTQQFSVVRIISHALFGWLVPYARACATWVLGESLTQGIGDWLSWFSSNQVNFTFWLLYLAAVCDDVGIPNIKSLARWGWRRFRLARQQPAASVGNHLSEKSRPPGSAVRVASRVRSVQD